MNRKLGFLKKIFIATFVFSLAGVCDEATRSMPLEKWLPKQEQISLKNLLRNISPAGTAKGAVVASPSKHEPDYWYHWVRDAALVMALVVDQYARTPSAELKAYYLNLIWEYVDFSRLNQTTPTPSGGPGEPKFHVDGSAFTGPWGRPQNDGPALRALTLIRFAQLLIEEGRPEEVKRLSSIIKYDLEFVSHHWRDASFDLWEEIKGHHFYTSIVQYQSMIEGASYLALLGDVGAKKWYLEQAAGILSELNRHWNSNGGFLMSTINRVGGIDYKHSNLDASVILGVLHASPSNSFSVADGRVQATLLRLKETFKNLYSVNQSGPSGVAIGRYPEDKYDGYSSGGEGNPWILTTNAFGEFYYRLARFYQNEEKISVGAVNHRFFEDLGFDLPVGQITRGDRRFSKIIERLYLEGDEYLNRVKFHVDSDGQMAEQMNRWSGFLQGARDLTWSYASFLTALEYRRR